jgi:hypothetical protein
MKFTEKAKIEIIFGDGHFDRGRAFIEVS